MKTGSRPPKNRNLPFPVCTSVHYGQTVRDINKSHKIDPHKSRMANHVNLRNSSKTGSEAPKIKNVVFPVCTIGNFGKTVRDSNKSHKIDILALDIQTTYGTKHPRWANLVLLLHWFWGGGYSVLSLKAFPVSSPISHKL